MRLRNQKVIAIFGFGVIAAFFMMVLQPISVSSAATPVLEITTSLSKSTALFTGETATVTVQMRNTGADITQISNVTSSSKDVEEQCKLLVGRTLLPEESVSCTQEGIQVSGLPAGKYQITTTVEAVSADNTKASFVSTDDLDLWWNGRIPGYWKNHSEEWNSSYSPNDFLQNVFVIPNALLTDGILDNDSLPGKDTLMSTLTYQGGTSLKGAGQILLRAASAALLNENYYGKSYPGAPSVEYLIARVNVVLASENKAQYIVLAGYFEKWNNGFRTALA